MNVTIYDEASIVLVEHFHARPERKEMVDSLDDLNFPHVAEWLLKSGAVGRRSPKPQAFGVVKRWRYIFHMEDGRQLCVGKEYVGTEPEAMWEGENRLCEHERGGGETPVSIEVQSQGKPNAKAHFSKVNDSELR